MTEITPPNHHTVASGGNKQQIRYIVDITTMANYFGRVTGITRAEREIARHFIASHPNNTQLVYWSNDKRVFETYHGPLDFEAVKAARISRDFSLNHSGFADFDLPQSEGDKPQAMIVSGSGWLQNKNYLQGCISLARNHDMKLVIYLHDLIPALFPYFYTDDYVATFLENLRIITLSGALVACNSRNTERDFLAWCAERGLEAPLTCIAYLGDNYEVPSQGDTTAEQEEAETLPDNIGAGPFVLAVGAVHRRKNYELLLPVWRRLSAQMGNKCPLLVIAGGVTSEGKALEAEIKADPVLRRYIRIIPAVTDPGLTALYKAAALVVYPSLYEGWGLPVAEALAHGRVCLASSGSAIPEIAELGDDFLSPDDVPAWTSRIQFYLHSERARTEREAALRKLYRPRSWTDTIASITNALDELPTPDIPKLFLGDTLRFNTADSRFLLASAAYGTESWGTWLKGREARIRFGFDMTGAAAEATLQLRLQLPAETTFDVRMNDSDLGKFIGAAGPASYSIVLPKHVLQSANTLQITARNMVTLPDKPEKLWAARTTGLGLISLSLFSQEQVKYDQSVHQNNGRGLISLTHHADKAIRITEPKVSDKKNMPGHLALYITCASRPSLPQIAGSEGNSMDAAVPCMVVAKAQATGPARLTIRQSGKIVYNNHVLVRSSGALSVWVDLANAHGMPDHPDIEMFLFDLETMQTISLELVSVLAPIEHFDLPVSQVLASLPVLIEKQFYKFGSDTEESPIGILCTGWTPERSFGVETDGGAALIAATSESIAPTTRLKLNCKLRDNGHSIVTLLINGQSHEVEMTDSIQTVFVEFPEPLESGSLISVVISFNDPQNTNEVVLRSLQLI